MAFDHGAYWADKMAKARRSVQNEMKAIFKWGAFFGGIFGNEGFIALQGKENHGHRGHTRSLKVRKIRRQRHRDRMRSGRA